MKTNVLVRIASVLLALCGVTQANASAPNYFSIQFCSSCSDDATYKAHAEAVVSSFTAGEWNILVINPNTLEMRDVWVMKERDMGFSTVISTAQPSPQNVQDHVLTAIDLFTSSEIVVPIGGGYGRDSYGTHTQEGVGDWLRTTPELGALVMDWYSIWNALTVQFSGAPIFIVVFPNGDVAKFRIVNPGGGAAGCCVYIPGSARDADGNVLDSQAPEGGNAYVGGSGGPSTGNPISIRRPHSGWSGGYRYVSCTKPVNSNIWVCQDV